LRSFRSEISFGVMNSLRIIDNMPPHIFQEQVYPQYFSFYIGENSHICRLLRGARVLLDTGINSYY
jgi:hypothetical protein